MYAKSRGIASIIVVGGIVVISAAIGFVSQRYMADDNFVEEFVEDSMDEAIEEGFHLPQHSVNIDLSPGSKED